MLVLTDDKMSYPPRAGTPCVCTAQCPALEVNSGHNLKGIQEIVPHNKSKIYYINFHSCELMR